ncbi:MAG: FHA domain-containing protein [Chloroflexota bacterium]
MGRLVLGAIFAIVLVSVFLWSRGPESTELGFTGVGAALVLLWFTVGLPWIRLYRFQTGQMDGHGDVRWAASWCRACWRRWLGHPIWVRQGPEHVRFRDLLPHPPLFGAGLVCALLAVLLFARGLIHIGTEIRYAIEGATVPGAVKSKPSRSSTNSLTIEFALPGRPAIVDQESLYQDVWSSLRQGQQITVQYLRSDPSTNRIYGQDSWAEVVVYALLGGLLLVAAEVLALRDWRSARRAARILSNGAVVAARVVDVRNVRQKWTGGTSTHAVFSYVDAAGHSRQGISPALDVPDAAALPGVEARVCYDTRAPERYVWLGLSESALAPAPPDEQPAPAAPPAESTVIELQAAPPSVAPDSPPPPESTAAAAPVLQRSAPAPAPSGPGMLVASGPDAGSWHPLGYSTATIGRSLAAEVQLTDDRVSYQHARLEKRDDGWRIRDSVGSGGTSVNGERLSADRVLEDGDEIQVGETVLRFQAG